MKKPLLLEARPELAALYSEANSRPLSSITLGSNLKVAWTLACGHTIERRVQQFMVRQSCGFCGGREALAGFNDVATTHRELLEAHWDYGRNELKPQELVAGSSRPVWWLCEGGHSQERELRAALQRPGYCSLCEGRKRKVAGYSAPKHLKSVGFSESLAATHPELREFYGEENSYGYEELYEACYIFVTWRQRCGHSFTREVNYFTKSQSCPFCGGRRALAGESDLRTLRPELIAYLVPDDATIYGGKAGSHARLRCHSCGGEELMRVGRIGAVPLCGSCRRRSSAGELAVASFLREAGYSVVQADRSLIAPQELDIYLPEVGLAIEYNGDYWHSEAVVRAKSGLSAEAYHGSKRRAAGERGLRLAFLWESQWSEEQALMESLLLEACVGSSVPRELSYLRGPRDT